MRLRLPPRLKRLIRELIAEEEGRRGRGTITKKEGHTTYVTDTDVDTPSLKIGGVEVIDSSRNIKNVEDADIGGDLVAYQVRVPGFYARPRAVLTPDGEVGLLGEEATENEPLKDSSRIYFRADYWDGSTSRPRYAEIRHHMLSTTPTSELAFRVPTGTNVMAIGDEGLKLWKDRLRLLSDSAKITFGSAEDVILYRAGADLLKTDDDFDARSLRIGGTEVITSGRVIQNVWDVYVINNVKLGGAIIHGESIFRNGMKLVEAEKVGLKVKGIAILNPEGELVAVITDKGDLLIKGRVRSLEGVD